jgi:hypothetical protein
MVVSYGTIPHALGLLMMLLKIPSLTSVLLASDQLHHCQTTAAIASASIFENKDKNKRKKA